MTIPNEFIKEIDLSQIVKYQPTDEVLARIETNFTYHAPQPDQPTRYGVIRDTAKQLAALLVIVCPESRELSLALTKLEESVMWANASIARNEKKT